MSLISFEYYYSLTEVTKIDIDQINNLKDEKLFVSVGGGIGAGKTFLTTKFVDLPIIDVDNYVSEICNGKYERVNLGEARKRFKSEIKKALIGEDSFIHMGTNSNLNETKKRLETAKANGFTTILVLVDTKPEIAIKQSQQRFESGERNSIPQNRIVESHISAVNVFEQIKKENKILDFYVHIER